MWFFKKGNTNTVECPHCGTKHTVEFLSYDNVCLDGMPKLPVKDLMKRFAVCSKCGLLYTTGKHTKANHAVTDEMYQNAFKMQYADITEKKLCLLNIMYTPACIPLFLAHYYAETHQENKRIQALQQAVDYIINHRDNYVQELHSCGDLTFEVEFLMQPEYRLVDLYRQMKEWDKATEQIEKLRNTRGNDKNKQLLRYLEHEELLLQKQDHTIQ